MGQPKNGRKRGENKDGRNVLLTERTKKDGGSIRETEKERERARERE
jgi:3-dehydroquinate dehydratase